MNLSESKDSINYTPVYDPNTGKDPPGRWWALLVLCSATLFSMSTWFSASAIAPELRQLWSLTKADEALLTVMVNIGFTVGAFLSAVLNLSDLIPPRYFIAIGCFGAALSNLFIVWTGVFWLGLILRFVNGAFMAFVYPPSMKAISTWFRFGRGLALGSELAAISIVNFLQTGQKLISNTLPIFTKMIHEGFIALLFFYSYFFEFIKEESAIPHLITAVLHTITDWQVIVYATSGLAGLGGLIAVLLIRTGPFPFPKAVFKAKQAIDVMRNKGVMLAYIGYFGHNWVVYAFWTWIYTFLDTSFQASPIDYSPTEARTMASYWAFATIASGAIGCIFGGIFGDQIGRTIVGAGALFVSAVVSAVIGVSRIENSVALIVFLSIVWGIFVASDSAQFSAMVTELGDQSYIGTALTMQICIGYLLTVPTMWMMPPLFDNPDISWNWAFAFLTIGPFFGIIAMFILRGDPKLKAKLALGRG